MIDAAAQKSENRISNQLFLAAIFHKLPEGASVTVTSFIGDPDKASNRGWAQYGSLDEVKLPKTSNNYFSISSHYPGADGKVKRKKSHFAALHAVVLDDIGKKIPVERITLAPSWIIETSPGNFQYGYVLAEPITNAIEADRLGRAVIDAQCSDPGAKGPTARNMRLPVAINGKLKNSDSKGKPFQCVLTAWNPSLHFSVDEFVEGLQIDLPSKREQQEVDSEAGYISAPSENPVLAELEKRGLYKKYCGDRTHEITCPWVNEHTGGVDGGSVYFEPNSTYPRGGFKCQHSHGEKYKIGALLEFLNINSQQARMRPRILVQAGELAATTDHMEMVLAASHKYFQRGGAIVTIDIDPSTLEASILPSSDSALTRELSRVCDFERYDMKVKGFVRTDPNERHVRVLYNSQSYRHLPPLAGLARQPYLRESGEIVSSIGYDPDTQIFGVWFRQDQFSIPEQPTKLDAQSALARLCEALAEFQFVDQYDHAAAIAGMLTAAIRPALPHAPMILVNAHIMGSGKSFLCKIFTAIATPANASPVSFPDTEEECGKMLLALLLRSPAVIEFDDMNSDLKPYSKLKTAITDESISGRILGQTKEISVSTRTLFLASGNNISVIGEMSRRVLTIHLDPKCETPATRTFKKPNLLADIKANREQFVSDCLTIVRAWIVAGRPEADIPSIGSMDEWTGYCRQSLIWLGLPDPAAKMFPQMKENPDAALLGRLIAAWRTNYRGALVQVRDLINHALDYPSSELRHVLVEIAGDRNDQIIRERLGRWITKHEGQFVEGVRIMRDNSSRSSAAWKLEVISDNGSSPIVLEGAKDGAEF